MDIVLEFISRRFKNNCNWLDGNCYYFVLILKNRFPKGIIYYDVIYGHFVFGYFDKYYDWTGEITLHTNSFLVKWDTFEEYDQKQKEVIIRDCIM